MFAIIIVLGVAFLLTACGGNDVIKIDGEINESTYNKFIRDFKYGRTKKVIVNSSGGEVISAIRIGTLIYNNKLDVTVDGICGSSCANYIFPSGKNKHIKKSSVVYFHGNIEHLNFVTQFDQDYKSKVNLEQLNKEIEMERNFYSKIGVDGFVSWFAKLKPYSVSGDYYLSVSDMEKFGIENVTLEDYDYNNVKYKILGENDYGLLEFVSLKKDDSFGVNDELYYKYINGD